MLHKSTTKLELILCSLSKGFLVTFLGSWDDRRSWRREEILRSSLLIANENILLTATLFHYILTNYN